MTDIVNKTFKKLQDRKLMLVTAESCTGGWVAKTITDIAGSSAIFERGFVTYTNKSKEQMLGVNKKTIEADGVVSENVVKEMASGALKNSEGDIAVSISGVAGPGGGSKTKPVGMVCFGLMMRKQDPIAFTRIFDGDREQIRKSAVNFVLEEINNLIK